MFWLLLSLALAETPGRALERPSRAPDAPGDCLGVAALNAGESRDCVSVSVPPASWSAAHDWKSYGLALEVELTTVAAEREVAFDVAEKREAEVERLRVDLEAAHRRATAARWEGVGLTVAAVALGVGVTLGAAYAVGQVAP